MYQTLLNDLTLRPNKSNWASKVRDLLCNLGFNHVWLSQDVGNEKLFINSVKQRVRDIFIQNWYSRLNNSTRALFYNPICNFELQPYLKHVNVQCYRNALSRLRVSSHRLNRQF